MSDNKKKLYDALSEEYDLGTFEQFSADIDNEEKRRKLYDATSNDYDYGDYDSFSAQLGFNNQPAETTEQAPIVEDLSLYEGSEPRRGFKAGAQESWKGLKAGTQFAYGEVANALFGSSDNDANALYKLDEMLREGKDVNAEVEGAWTDAGRELRTGALEFLPNIGFRKFKERVRNEAEQQRVLDDIREVIGEAGGDIAKARELLVARASDKSYGDIQKEKAKEKFADVQETEGFGAWVGENAIQMIPSASALIVGALSKSPGAARAIGMIGMGGMTASTAGSSMYEAREAGASDYETRKVGVVDGALEYITEKLPFDNYTNWMMGKAKGKVTTNLAKALRSGNAPLKSELEELLKAANKELGGKLFSKKNLSEYIADMVAEGASEFTAEASQTMTKLIYENPDLFPLLGEAVSNGMQGALAGFFMGGILGGAATTMEHQQHKQRRKEQGHVDVGVVDFGDGQNEIVEILSVDEDTNRATVLHNGAVENVNKNAIGQSYRYSYEAFEAGRMKVEESEAIDNGTVSEGKLKASTDRLNAATTSLTDALRAEGFNEQDINEVLESEGNSMFVSDELQTAYDDYIDARSRDRELNAAFRRQKETQRGVKRLDIEEAVGEQFWREIPSENEDGVTTWDTIVTYATLQDGRKVYLFPGIDATETSGVTEDGQKIFVTPDMLVEGSEVTENLDDYLDNLLADEKKASEQERMSRQTVERTEEAKKAAQPGTQVNLGTTEEPIVGTIMQATPDGVIVQSNAGVVRMTWEEYANAMNIGSVALTDEETASFEASEILSAESQYKAQQATNVTDTEEALAEAVEAENQADTIDTLPKKDDGSVDQTTLWNQNPEKWAQWNDEQRQDGGANSLAYINTAIAKEATALAKKEKTYDTLSDFAARDKLEEDIKRSRERIARLTALQQRYAPAEEMAPAAAEATETTAPTEAAPIEVAPTDRVMDTISGLYNDESLSESEIEDYIAANVAGSQADLDKHLAKAPKMGRDLNKYKAEKEAYDAKTAELTVERDFWKEVQDYNTIPETEMDMEPQNALEFTARELGLKDGIKLLPESVEKHTNLKGAERQNFLSIVRTKKNGGISLEEAGERLMEMDRENNTGFFDQSDPNAGLNAIIDILLSSRTSGDVSGYIRANREQMAREAMTAARNAMAEEMVQPEVATEVASELEGDLPLDIFPDVAPLETRLRTTQSSETSGEFAEIKERAAAWAKRLGIKVNVLESIDQVEDAIARDAISRGVSAPGWFDPKTGEVYIYAPHNPNLSEVDKTIIHEVISHKGLRGLLGKARFNSLCDAVWSIMNPEAKAFYLNYENVLTKARKAEYNANPEAFKPTAKERRAAADEFIAMYSESVNVDKNAWQKMVASVKRFINKLTGKYTLGDQLDELIEASLARYEQIAKVELKGVVEEGTTYKGVMDAETGAMINPNANEQAEGNTALRAKDGTLVGMHNISEDKLRKAIKQGGLANPSTAVVNIAEYSLEGYGDISLIMPSSLVDSETGDNAGTYTGDAWTPTYPTISRQLDDAGWKLVKDRIRAAVGESDDLYHDIVNSVDNYLSDDRNSRLEFVFLKEKGIEPKIEMKGADGYVGLRNLEAILGVEGLRDSMESYEKYKAASPMAKRSFNMWQRVGGDKKAHKALKDEIRQYPQFAKLMGLDEDLTFAGFDSFTYSIFRKEYDAGNVNTIDTLGGASRYVDANDMRTEFEMWLESLMEEAGAKEVFFAGWTRDGDRIYKDNTLENVSRYMRMQGRTNVYNDHGLSATKSALLQRLTSLAEIRKNRARLQDESSYNKAYDKLKDRLFSVISQLADMEKISDNPFMNIDYAEARLQEAIVKRNPISYLNNEYGYSIDPKGEYAEELKSFIKDVQKMPAKYFETKFERPVYLNEFAAAVMPNNTSEDVKQALTEAGLPIFEYDSAVEGARREATLKATEEEGVRFRILGEMGAANLDAAEEATTRLDNLDVARQMEEAGKDAKTIRLATGWERGVDNLWRYEVPDEYDLANLEKRLQEELDNGAAKTWGIVYPSDLGQLLKEYPDFNVDIMVWVGDEFENTGAYSPATEGDENTFGRSASIEVEAKTIADVAPLLAHEIQHAIQEMEGFAEGGQARGLSDKLSAELDKRVATIKQLREEGRNEEADELMQMSKGLAEAVINNEDDAYGNYKKLAGEVEARNAAKRIGMSLQERRESLLSETEDVAREDQIILMESLGVNHMADGNGGIRLTSSNASIARFDKVNGTDVRGFIDFLKNDKEFVAGKPTVFHIANAGDLLGQFGIKGKFMVGQFTFSRTHTVNADHELGVKEWIDVINNLNNPIAITSYKGQPNQFRIYTYATINGRNICVGVNVSTKDGSIELANIISAYGRDIQNLLGNESVFLLYPATIQELKQKISQVSTAHNSLLNATSSALSADKGSNNFGESNTRFRVSNENQAIFVSNAAKAVEGIKMEKATPEQWLKMIEKNGGLKAGEDKWMGLSDWLKASDKKTLTKAEVLDFINENMIIIEEQHYEEDAPDEEALWYEYEESEEGVDEINYQMQLDAENHAELALAGRDLTDEEWEEEYDRLVSDYIEDDLFGSARSAAKDAVRERWMEEEAPKIMEGRPKEINTTRLNYTTAGLTNLHEIALTVPTIESWNEYDAVHFGDAGEGRAVAWIRFGDAKKLLGTTEVEGKKKFNWAKVLVIDEIQSKRHQEGRDRGYSMSREEFQKKLDALETEGGERLRRRTELLRTLEEKYGEDFRYYLKPSFNGDILANMPYVPNESVMSPEEVQEWNATSQEEINDAIDALKKQKRAGVPDAPFDKNWHELAMKRMLRYAAENGYDVIAWTKGEQQAERYSLTTHISDISRDDVPGVEERRFYLKGRNANIRLLVDDGGIVTYASNNPESGKPLSDYVGKELAAKMMALDNKQSLEGEGIEMGGEGMKGFYDKMLPAFMNKYGKKWGVKVEDIELNGLENGLTMHSIPVTEEMKSSVMEGQVMFRINREDYDSAVSFTEAVVQKFSEKYFNTTPISILDGTKPEEALRALGLESMFTPKDIENVLAGYIEGKNIIAIFAKDRVREVEIDEDVIENAIFHECIHQMTTGKKTYDRLSKYLWDNADTLGLSEQKADIEAEYEESQWYYEMIASALADKMTAGKSEELLRSLPAVERAMTKVIFNKFGYEPGKEDIRRANANKGISRGNLRNEESRSESQRGSSSETRFRATEITPEVRAEMDTIAATAIVNGNYLKAPNGADTNLTPEQWAMVRTKNFIDWFGDWINDPENASKVVDENGEPKVVYHGTPWNPLEESVGKAVFKSGWYTGMKRRAEGFGEPVAVFLNIKNPAYSYDKGKENDSILPDGFDLNNTSSFGEYDGYISYIDYPEVPRISELAKRRIMVMNPENYEEVINQTLAEMPRGRQIYSVIPKNPSQIKSATDNTGEFSNEDGDIRFRMTDSKGNILTPEQERFFANSKAVDKDGNLLVLYHGTPRAGFTEFTSGWFTTSKEDAISYSGDRKGRLFDPNEKYEPETLVAGDYRLGYMTFDSEEDRAAFLAEYPGAESAMSEAEFDSMTLQADEEYDDLIARKPELQKIWNAYREYERERFVDTAIGDIMENAVAYTEDDLRRAMLAYDSNANFDSLDDMDAEERRDALVTALRNADEETEGGIADIKVATRVPRNGEGRKHNDLGNRTYEVYANVENPYEIDANGRGSEFESGDIYKAVEEALTDEQYDGVIIRNWRVGRYQQLGDVVVPKSGSQIKLTSNENPSEGSDIRFRTSLELDEEFGDAWRNQQNEDGRHSTQVANTKSTYEKIGRYLEEAGMKGASILDASSGLGLGTQALREMGFNVEDVEPFPSENREAPTFSSYADIDGKYDVVISNAVLNVIPDDWRADVLHQMADAVKDGGKMIINTRPASNIAQQGVEGKTRITLDSPSEILVKRGDRIAAYQKGFTSEELAEWIKSELGEGWRVEKATKKNSGISGEGTAVVIKEYDDTRFRTIGTPTEDVVAQGISLSPSQTASLAGDIFAALPEESRKKITDGLNGNILGLQDAIMQIPTSLAMKEDWNEEDTAVAEAIAREMDKFTDPNKSRPLSTYEALWMLYDAMVPASSLDLVDQASRVIVKRNLGLDEASLERRNGYEDDIRFRTVGDASINAQASLYNKGVVDAMSRLKESFVDMNTSVEKLVRAIERKTGKKAEGFEDILKAMNQQASKGDAAMKSYLGKFLEPMFKAVRDIMDAGHYKYEDVVRYVILKHGLERNDVFAKRDAKEYYRAGFDKKVAAIMANSSLSDAEKQAKIDEAQADLDFHNASIDSGSDAKYQELRENDYSGLSSMFYDQLDVDRKNYDTEEEYQSALMAAKADKYSSLADIENAAKTEVENFENAVNTDNLWAKINAATKETLKQQYEANMISKDQYEGLRDMFQFYVPLRGFKDNTAEDMYTYYSKPNKSGYTKPILAAEGRKTEAESPFGWIASMAGSAIASDVKNEAKLALYYFISNRPDNGIATISKTWFVDSGEVDADGKAIFKPVYPPFSEDLSSDAAKANYEAWQENMRKLRDKGMAYESGQRLNLGNAVVHISDVNKPEHVVAVKVAGKDYTIIVNGNPRAAQAINGMLNIEATAQDYRAHFGPLLRWMSSVNTSYNPEFWITNFMRDTLFTFMSVSVKEDPTYRRKFYKNYAKAFKVIKMTRQNYKGTLGDSYLEEMYKDFNKYGGITGATQIKGNEEWEKEIAKYLASEDPNSIKKGWLMRNTKELFTLFHQFGESLEQVSRFAAFLTAREMGKPMAEAIDDAKEITVNFNRKGSGKRITLEEAKYLTNKKGQPLNDFQKWMVVGLSSIASLGRRTIMFFNAAIQGLNATAKLVKKNPKKFAAWSLAYFAIGVMNAVLHNMFDDDDDYLDMPEYERRNALMLGGNGVYFKWALPQEMRVFYGLGDLAVEEILGRNPHESALGEAVKIISEIAPINPTEGWRALLPSVAIPFVELGVNEDYKGDPIYNEQKWLTEEERKRSPKWETAFKGTGRIYIAASKLFNSITDGPDYDETGWINIQPEKIEHLVQSAFGGTVRTADKAFSSLMNAFDPDEDVTIRQFPFVNRVLTLNDERYKNVHVNDVFDWYEAEALHALALEKKYRKNKMNEELDRLRASDEYKWAEIYRGYKTDLKLIKAQIKAAEKTNDRMHLMKIQDQIKKSFIKEISDLKNEGSNQ